MSQKEEQKVFFVIVAVVVEVEVVVAPFSRL